MILLAFLVFVVILDYYLHLCNLQLCNFYQKLSQYLTKNYKYLFDLTKYTGKRHEIMYYNKLSYSKLLTLFDMKYHKYVMYLF